MEFKEKKEPVKELIFSLGLAFTEEDKKQIGKLIDSYFRKRSNFVNSGIENLAGGLLWVYSRINFLFEGDNSWSQQGIAGRIGINPNTISSIAGRMMKALKIDYFDARFARQEVAKKHPFNDFFMTQSGFILHKNDVRELVENQMLREIPVEAFSDEEDPAEEEIQEREDKRIESNSKNKKLSEFFK